MIKRKMVLIITVISVCAYGQFKKFPNYAPIEKYDIIFATLDEGGYLKDFTNIDGSLASNISYIARSLSDVYNATYDRFFLDRLSVMVDDILATRDDKKGVESPGDTVAGWSCNAFTGGENHIWIIHSALILEPIIDYLLILKGDDRLFEEFKDRFNKILAEVEKSVEIFDSDYVKLNEKGEGYYVDDYLKKSYNDKGNLPFNHQNAMGKVLIKLWYLTGKEKYLNRAKELAKFFKRHLVLAQNKSYVWEYRVPVERSLAEYPEEEKTPKVFKKAAANVSVAALDIGFVVLCFKTGIVFNSEDINRFINTFGNFYKGYGHVSSNIDGSGTIHMIDNHIQLGRWLDLAEFNRQIWDSVENEYNAYIVEPVFSGPVLLGLAKLALYEIPEKTLTSALFWTLNKFAYQNNRKLKEIKQKNNFPQFQLDITSSILDYIYNLLFEVVYKNKQEFVYLREWYDNIISELENGNNVFSDCFTEPGKYTNNHTLLKNDGKYYLYYVTGELNPELEDVKYFGFRLNNNEKGINLAVSSDLVTWDLKGEVFHIPENSWDCRVIWSPYIFENEGKYYMYYTGCNRQLTQRIGVAASDDLINWERKENAVVVPDTSWAYWNEDVWADCRDPMIIKERNKFIMYYTARNKNLNYVIAAAESDDLINWEDKGQILEGARIPLESPYVIKMNNTYHMFYTLSGNDLYQAISTDPLLGWDFAGGDAYEIENFEGANIELIKEGNDFLASYNVIYPHLISFVKFGTLKRKKNNIFEFTIGR